MKRKTFLKRFAGALGALVAAPKALEALEPEPSFDAADVVWPLVDGTVDLEQDTVKVMLVNSGPPPPPIRHWNCRCVICEFPRIRDESLKALRAQARMPRLLNDPLR